MMLRYDEYLNDTLSTTLTYQSKKLKRYKIYTYVLILCVVLCICVSINLSSSLYEVKAENEALKNQLSQQEEISQIEYSIGYWLINQSDEINDSILLSFFRSNGAWYPEVLVKQAKIESANYTSNIFTRNNNMFGMKRATSRQNTQTGGSNQYANYKNWQLSALDRLLWDRYFFDGEKPPLEEYLNIISKVYAEDPNYVNKIK